MKITVLDYYVFIYYFCIIFPTSEELSEVVMGIDGFAQATKTRPLVLGCSKKRPNNKGLFKTRVRSLNFIPSTWEAIG